MDRSEISRARRKLGDVHRLNAEKFASVYATPPRQPATKMLVAQNRSATRPWGCPRKSDEISGALRSLVLLCYKQSQAPSVTKRAGGELLDKMSGNLNS